ncbi:putative photosynthetic complex assembly protein PuhE [Ideonella sp. DXS29W]|uniref:Photosynthetic complex assembly protein PuhE n=1 Tax=Ideonella lacteola TaxID=2984193 RepID=A0ABU9BMV9_9BURK
MQDAVWHQAAPVVYTLFAWWFSTGVILYLVGMPRATHKWTMTAATLMLIASLAAVALTAGDTGHAAVYVAFTAALGVWAWQEVAFLLGYVTGARRQPCPEQAQGWQRARLALQTVLHHEIALLILGGLLAVLTWRQPNQAALATYAILWVMRQSAKLNLFLGVRNLNERFLPSHLAYLASYFRRRPMNALFPLSVLVSSVAAVWWWRAALGGGLTAAAEAAAVLSATLLTLGLLEHWFMVLPLPSHALWNWGLRSRA